MKFYFLIIFFIITNILFSSNNNYIESTQLAYKPLNHSSLINIHVAFYKFKPTFGAQWWVSNNLQLSGMISHQVINTAFSLYNNIAIGYYNENIKWFKSSSNFIEISLHKIKYNSLPLRWINCAYKSRYDYKNFILGYDLNHYFWKDIRNNFISLIMGYKIANKIILELKSNINNHNVFSSFNCSISF